MKLYTTKDIHQIIFKSYRLANQLTECMTNTKHAFYASKFKSTPTNEICKILPLHRSTIPKKFLKTKKINESLHIVASYEPAIIEDREEEDKTDRLTEYEVMEMQERFIKWYYDNTDYKISQFMRDIDPLKIYTKNDILHIFSKYNIHHGNWNNLFRFVQGNTNGYGKIFRNNQNDTYQLYPQLINIYRQIFMV